MDEEKLRKICGIRRESKQCRYLQVINEELKCVKKDPELKAVADKKVEDSTFTLRSGKKVILTFAGDNCEGE